MNTKTCKKCKVEKEIIGFYKCIDHKDGLQSYCKECLLENSKKDYKQNNRKELFAMRSAYAKRISKKFVDELKTKLGCCNCEESGFCCIDFHHLEDKTIEISTLVRLNSKKRLLKELLKCSAVCANCHRKIHANKISIESLRRVTENDFNLCKSFSKIRN